MKGMWDVYQEDFASRDAMLLVGFPALLFEEMEILVKVIKRGFLDLSRVDFCFSPRS